MANWDDLSRAGKALVWLHKMVGRSYKLGAEAKLTESAFNNPSAFSSVKATDCSELVQMMCWAVGCKTANGHPLAAFDPAWKQYELSRHISVKTAINLPGALLFRQNNSKRPYKIGHVAVSLGNGYVIEAANSKSGVRVGKVDSGFTLAGKIPELYQ